MAGRDDPHIHLKGLDPADALKGLILQDLQEFDLHVPGKFPDFIEEDGPFVGQFKFPRLGRCRPGKGALLIAKQFRFNETFGDGPAVDFNEGVVLSRAPPVDGPGDQFFPCARLTGDQDRGPCRGNLFDRRIDLLDFFTAADNAGIHRFHPRRE